LVWTSKAGFRGGDLCGLRSLTSAALFLRFGFSNAPAFPFSNSSLMRCFAFRSATSIIRRCPQGVGEFLQPCSRFWWCHGVVRRGFALLSAGFLGLSSACSSAGIPRLAARMVAPQPQQPAEPPEWLVSVCAASSCAAAQPANHSRKHFFVFVSRCSRRQAHTWLHCSSPHFCHPSSLKTSEKALAPVIAHLRRNFLPFCPSLFCASFR